MILTDTRTLTGRSGLTVMITVLDKAGLPEKQGSFEVIMHEIRSPFNGAYEYVGLVAPVTIVPFTFH